MTACGQSRGTPGPHQGHSDAQASDACHGSEGPEFCTDGACFCRWVVFRGVPGIHNVIIGSARKRPLSRTIALQAPSVGPKGPGEELRCKAAGIQKCHFSREYPVYIYSLPVAVLEFPQAKKDELLSPYVTVAEVKAPAALSSALCIRSGHWLAAAIGLVSVGEWVGEWVGARIQRGHVCRHTLGFSRPCHTAYRSLRVLCKIAEDMSTLFEAMAGTQQARNQTPEGLGGRGWHYQPTPPS